MFDIDAVRETIAFSRQVRTPYAVVFNAAPPKRQDTEAPAVTLARRCLAQLKVPVWGGQITHRASFSLALSEAEGVKGYNSDPGSTAEISGLWSAIEKSVQVIRGAREKAAAMHRVAALILAASRILPILASACMIFGARLGLRTEAMMSRLAADLPSFGQSSGNTVRSG